MNRFFFGVLALAATGCATVNPFEKSDEAMMAQVMDEASMSKDLDSWLRSAGSANVVFVNMEDPNYTDDQNPEYMVLDYLYTKIKDGNSAVKILERDPDVLNIVQKENNGLDLPASFKPGDVTSDSLSIERRRSELGNLIWAIVNDVAPQDVLVALEDECCKDGGHAQDLEDVIANEVGKNKSDLLKWLVKEYYGLYPTVNVTTRHVDVENADYLIGYRVYDYGAWKSRTLTGSDRITYVKLHVRVIDMKTGEIIVSDFMSNSKEDRLSNKEMAALAKSSASQSDYGRPSSRSSRSGRDAAPKQSTPSYEPADDGSTGGLLGSLLDKLMFWK